METGQQRLTRSTPSASTIILWRLTQHLEAHFLNGSDITQTMTTEPLCRVWQSPLSSKMVCSFVHVRGVPVDNRGDNQVQGHDTL